MILEFGNIWSLNLSFCEQLIQTSFYLRVLVTCMQEWEIGSVTARLPDNPEELEYMYTFKKSAKL